MSPRISNFNVILSFIRIKISFTLKLKFRLKNRIFQLPDLIQITPVLFRSN